jgi:hypothetical protein
MYVRLLVVHRNLLTNARLHIFCLSICFPLKKFSVIFEFFIAAVLNIRVSFGVTG